MDAGVESEREESVSVIYSEFEKVSVLRSIEGTRCALSPGGDVMYKVSDDNGKTWSSGQVVLSYGSEDGMPKVIANTLVELEDGSWVLPFWREPGRRVRK